MTPLDHALINERIYDAAVRVVDAISGIVIGAGWVFAAQTKSGWATIAWGMGIWASCYFFAYKPIHKEWVKAQQRVRDLDVWPPLSSD